MPKFADDSVTDAYYDNVATSTVMHVCSSQPANFAGIAAASLGSVAVSGADFVKSGTGGTRKTTIGAKSVPITTTGTANWVALATGTVLKYVTAAGPRAFTAGDTANQGSWSITVAQPT